MPDFLISHNIFTDEKNIKRNFCLFDAKGYVIDSISKAAALASDLGKYVLPETYALARNEKNKEKKNIIRKTAQWIKKKTVSHPALVKKSIQKIVTEMKGTERLKELKLPFREIYTDLSITAVLHDIGRLSEVDLMNGVIMIKRSLLNKNHSELSYHILKDTVLKNEIKLAILFHEKSGIKELCENEIYKSLTPEAQARTKFYALALQDADKTGNLIERSINGIKKCAEFCDPNYLQDYGYTKSFAKTALEGKYLNNKDGHLLDAMTRFVTWTYSIEFNETKKILATVMKKFFCQMYDEAIREYDASAIKDSKKLSDTLDFIIELEKYVIVTRFDIPLLDTNIKRMQKISAEYRKKQD